jgi:hypothetical protein
MKTRTFFGIVASAVMLLCFQQQVFSQNLQKLDEDNGYRIFKIDSKFDNFEDSLQPLNLGLPTSTGYKFIGSDTSFQNIAGIRPFVIQVFFDFSNNLVKVSAYLFTANNGRNFEKRTDKMFETLKTYYTERYGNECTKSILNSDVMRSGGIRYVWQTENVTFTMQVVTGKNTEWRIINVIYTKTGFYKKDGYNE